MRRGSPVLLALGSAALTAPVSAGDLCKGSVYCDDFDDYVPGLLIGQDCGFAGHRCDGVNFCPVELSWQSWNMNPDWGRSVVVRGPAESAPHAVEVKGPDDLVHTYHALDLTSGLWEYSADLFIPETFVGESYFILLNTYTSSEDANWSTQVHFESEGDRVISDFDDGVQNDVRFVRGEWRNVRVIIDLDSCCDPDRGQQIYYGEQLVIVKSWVDKGQFALEALNLFASDSSPVYWDNFKICEVAREGACCFEDASCLAGQDPDDCESAGGVFQGFGTPCGGQCPRRGPNGWEVEAPIVWDDTQGRNDTCDAGATCEDTYEGDDLQLEVTIPWPSHWTISTAGSELLDTEMLIGTAGLCSDNLVDDDGCVGPGCSGGQDEEGSHAVFRFPLGEGDVIAVDVEEFSGECGRVRVSVTGPCAAITLPPGDREGETCGVAENDGCNMEPGREAFTDIALGQTILGESSLGNGDTVRDTDWYQLVLAKDTSVKMTMYGEYGGPGVGGIVQYNEGMEGSGDCADITGSISPFGTFNRCVDYPSEGALVIEADLVAGTWWFFAGPTFGGADFACGENPGTNYYITVEQAPSCTEAPDGDVDFDGDTDLDDLLLVLSNWDTPGPPGDSNCDGVVDLDDLLQVLGNWS